VNEVNWRLQKWRKQSAPQLGMSYGFTEIEKGLANRQNVNVQYQIDFIEQIETPQAQLHKFLLLFGDPLMLMRNMDARAELTKGRHCHAIARNNQLAVIQFDDSTTKCVTRIPMEETAHRIKVVRR
jgi:hypothetical protein